jgi:hypothetical protein
MESIPDELYARTRDHFTGGRAGRPHPRHRRHQRLEPRRNPVARRGRLVSTKHHEGNRADVSLIGITRRTLDHLFELSQDPSMIGRQTYHRYPGDAVSPGCTPEA